MRTYRDAKAMAKSLRASLNDKGIDLSHGECLEIVSVQFAEKNWNILSDRILALAKTESITELRAPIPILRIFSEEKALEFYVDYLGFAVEWRHRFSEQAPLYMQVSRGDATLHLSEHHGDATPGAAVFFWMKGIDAYHRELHAKNYPFAGPGIEDTPWDARAMDIRDPFGNRVFFNEAKAQESKSAERA
ncbi:MAG: glyoxalase superfamily protein [Pseudomonadota bacterium]